MKSNGNLIDREMEVKHWTNTAYCVRIIEGQEDSKHTVHVYTESSRSEHGVRSGVAILTDSNLTDTTKYGLNGRRSNNQTEQLAILKSLEKIQKLEDTERTVSISTDSWITLESLKNRKKHTHLIENIRTEVIEMEKQNWKINFNWIKAHAGHNENELADQHEKEAVTSRENK